MLQLGDAGLSPDEAQSHYSAWAVVAAPLLISADLVSGLDAGSLAILAAPEVRDRAVTLRSSPRATLLATLAALSPPHQHTLRSSA